MNRLYIRLFARHLPQSPWFGIDPELMVAKAARGTGADHRAAPLGRALGFMRLLWAVAHGLESTSKRMHATLGVTGPQRLVLRLVGHHTTMSAGELARTMHIHPSSLTGMLRRLHEARLIERQSHPLDARRAVLTLTAKGRRLNKSTSGTVEAVVERALRGMPVRDLRAAQRALQILADEFDAE